MANSKTSLSIGLLFFVFLSSQVLAHDVEREADNLNVDGIHPAREAANNNHPPAANDNQPGYRPIIANNPKKKYSIASSPFVATFHNQKAIRYNPSELNDIDVDGIHLAREAANDNHPPAANDNQPGYRPIIASNPKKKYSVASSPFVATFHNQNAIRYNPSELNDIDVDGIHPAREAANNNHPPAANDNQPGYRPIIANNPKKKYSAASSPFVATFHNQNAIRYNPSKLNDFDVDGIHPVREAANNNHPPAANDNYPGYRPIIASNPKKKYSVASSPLVATFHNQNAIRYNPSKLNNIEPENHEHGYVIKDDSKKPSEIDQRNGDKTSYNNVGVEDVGEQTIEDET